MPACSPQGRSADRRTPMPRQRVRRHSGICLLLIAGVWTSYREQPDSSSVAAILAMANPLFTALLVLWSSQYETVNRKWFAGLIVGSVGHTGNANCFARLDRLVGEDPGHGCDLRNEDGSVMTESAAKR